MELQQIEDKLKTVLKPSRYRHTLGVAYTASCMAMVFDVDTERAYRAASKISVWYAFKLYCFPALFL